MHNDNFIVCIGAFVIFFFIIGCGIYVLADGVRKIKLPNKKKLLIRVAVPSARTIEEKFVKTLANGRQIIVSTKEKAKQGVKVVYYARQKKRSFLTKKAEDRYNRRRYKNISKKIFRERLKNGERIDGTINSNYGDFVASENFKRKYKQQKDYRR